MATSQIPKYPTLILNDERVRARALLILESVPLDPVLEVVIREHKSNRSMAQKGLYFDWVGRVANALGEEKEDVHIRCKRKFFLPVYIRDQTEPYYSTALLIENVKQYDVKAAKDLRENLVRLTSTNDANTAQFTECLNDLEKQAISLGIFLPHPGEYDLAMGIKKKE